MKNNIVHIISIIASIITIGIIFNISMTKIDQYLKIKAIDDCGKITRYEKIYPEEGATISYPVQDIYETCVKEKGY